MIKTLILSAFFFFGCGCGTPPSPDPEISKASPERVETIRARITYYSSDPVWGDRVSDPKTRRAKEGVTVAAHPSFAFGSKIRIPELDGVVGDGEYKVQDRGPAVTRKTAAGRSGAYVFDVYVQNRSRVKALGRSQKEWMTVQILSP